MNVTTKTVIGPVEMRVLNSEFSLMLSALSLLFLLLSSLLSYSLSSSFSIHTSHLKKKKMLTKGYNANKTVDETKIL